MKFTTLLTLTLVILPCLCGASEGFKQLALPLLDTYCIDCHDNDTAKGDFSLEEIDGDLINGMDVAQWEEILHQLELGQMPPEDKKQLSPAQVHSLTQWIRAELLKGGRKPEFKLLRPGAGNNIKHTQLFGTQDFGPAFSPARIWRIRPSVYESGIKSIAKNGKYMRPFTLKSGGQGFRDYDNQYVLAGADLNQLMANAATAAKQLTEVRQNKGKVGKGNSTPTQLFELIHPNDAPPTEAKVDEAIQWLYDRVLLRSPSHEEKSKLKTFAMNSMETDGKLLGVRNMISAVLLNPEALYRSERGSGIVDEHGRTPLSPRELAYAIAYALTDTRPDQNLLKIAESGKLMTREDVAVAVNQILNNPKVDKPRILGFFREYFGYADAVNVFKDDALNRSHTPEVLVSDTDKLVMYIYNKDKDVLKEMLTTNKSFVQYRIDKGKPAQHHAKDAYHTNYNLPPDWKWHSEQPIELPKNQRAGILTQPSWLVAMSDNFENHAIHRGLWVRGKLLGGPNKSVPITVDAELPNDETMTLREKMHVTAETYCWTCHKDADPLGLTFEMYDHFGRWRTKELKKPVVTDGSIDRSGDPKIDGKVHNAVEMLHKMAQSEHVRQVFVRHAFRYFMGRNETLRDASTLRAADKAYVESGGSMKQMILSLLTCDSFLYRKG